MRSRGLNKSTGRAFVLCPLIFSAAAFALALVALFAGSKPGQMEDYHIISVSEHADVLSTLLLQYRH